MPYKLPTPCSYPGCPELCTTRYCDRHRTVASREYDRNNRRDHEKYYGWAWRKVRNRYFARHPLCEECLKSGRHVPAVEVHHLVPPELGGSNLDDNLVSLCQSCHTKTRSHRPGGGC